MDTIVIESPVTGDRLAEVVEMPPEEVSLAVDAARASMPELMALSIWERADLLQRTSDELVARRAAAIEDHLDEHGKTRAEAEAEFAECVRLDPSMQPKLEKVIREAKGGREKE